MKDAGIQVFSHDPVSGAGGANVVELKSYLAPKLGSVFQRLPALQDMRVGWRQFVGPRGEAIEDVGVTADYVLHPKLEDFLGQSSVFSYLETISEALAEKVAQSGDAKKVFCM